MKTVIIGVKSLRAPLLIIVVTAMTLSGPLPLYGDKPDTPSTKLGRGVANAVFGWGEIIRQVEIAQEEQGTTRGLFTGLALGAWWGVKRTAVGLQEIFTFPFRGDTNYGPTLEPEFVFSHPFHDPNWS